MTDIIELYFQGNKAVKSLRQGLKTQSEVINVETLLLSYDFFNQKFRDCFSAVTSVSPFKFNVDTAPAWRKVKRDNNLKFTIQDMIKIYYGESDYARRFGLSVESIFKKLLYSSK